MGYRETIQRELQAATKAGHSAKRDTLRLLLSALTNEEVAQEKAELDQDAFSAVVQRELKRRREAIEAYQAAGRPERAAAENAELEVLEGYLPRQLSAEEVEAVVRQVLEGFPGEPSLGPIMGQAMGRLKGRADGHAVRQVVTRLLQGG